MSLVANKNLPSGLKAQLPEQNGVKEDLRRRQSRPGASSCTACFLCGGRGGGCVRVWQRASERDWEKARQRESARKRERESKMERDKYKIPWEREKTNVHLYFYIHEISIEIELRNGTKNNFRHMSYVYWFVNRAKYFIICNSNEFERRDLQPATIKGLILQNSKSKFRNAVSSQLNLFG